MAEKEEVLLADRLCSGDKPSICAVGMVVAQALKKSKLVTLAVNPLGEVVVVSPDAVTLKPGPMMGDGYYHNLDEEQAIHLLMLEGVSEEGIVEYLKRRDKNGTTT